MKEYLYVFDVFCSTIEDEAMQRVERKEENTNTEDEDERETCRKREREKEMLQSQKNNSRFFSFFANLLCLCIPFVPSFINEVREKKKREKVIYSPK